MHNIYKRRMRPASALTCARGGSLFPLRCRRAKHDFAYYCHCYCFGEPAGLHRSRFLVRISRPKDNKPNNSCFDVRIKLAARRPTNVKR